jgi:hypothetical protein
MVNFRVAEEEYERLRSACAAVGARSVSEFARKAVFLMAGLEDTPAAPPGEWGRKIDDRVEELNREIRRLAELVEGASARPACEVKR